MKAILTLIENHPRSSEFVAQHRKAVGEKSFLHLHKNFAVAGQPIINLFRFFVRIESRISFFKVKSYYLKVIDENSRKKYPRLCESSGFDRAGTLVICKNDAAWGDLGFGHLERRRNGAVGKKSLAAA